MEILELKNTIPEIKILLNDINSRIQMTEKRVNKLEAISTNQRQYEEQSE